MIEPMKRLPGRHKIHAVIGKCGGFGGSGDAGEVGIYPQLIFSPGAHVGFGFDPKDRVAVFQEQLRQNTCA